MSFAERLADQIARCGNPICLGIDPHLSSLPKCMTQEIKRFGALKVLERFSETLIGVAAEQFSAVKFQSAFYEAYGWGGVRVLQEAIHESRAKGLMVILDAKRGDIASTMSAYGTMAFETFGADALTVTPYMGRDVITSLVPWLRQDKGAYVVWIGSNTRAGDISLLKTQRDGVTVAEHILSDLQEVLAAEDLPGSLGLVLGATMVAAVSGPVVQMAAELPLLLPGIGPQGGEMTDALRSILAKGRSLIPMSRALAGLGDPARQTALEKLNSWDEYRSFVSELSRQAILGLV